MFWLRNKKIIFLLRTELLIFFLVHHFCGWFPATRSKLHWALQNKQESRPAVYIVDLEDRGLSVGPQTLVSIIQ